MQFIKKIGLATLMMTMSGIAASHTMSSDIALNGGQAGFNQVINISLDKLLDNVLYSVVCTLSSNHKSNETFDDIKIYTPYGSGVEFRVNGIKIDASGQINIPNAQTSQLIAYGITKNTKSIYIRNLDDTDTVTAAICYAEPWRS